MNFKDIKKDFPILNRKVNNKQLVYFDNAATTQKPIQVIEAITKYYTLYNSNVHRGVHYLSNKSTQYFEEVRNTVKSFVNAKSEKEIIYTKGTSEGINLIAATYGRQNIKEGDEIIISNMEHHSNIVPWQLLCEEKKAKLKVIPIDNQGNIILEDFQQLLCERTKIVSVMHVSNTLGTINPIEKIIKMAHEKNAIVVIDGAQASAHEKIDVQKLNCDFYAFSGHKIHAPTGIGVLYGKEKLLNAMPPYQSGGEMIKSVSFEKTVFNELPFKFEPGTPNISGVIGLGEAIKYIQNIGIENINKYEKRLFEYANQQIQSIDNLQIIGLAKKKTAIFSFNVEGIHFADIGNILDKFGVAVRAGLHCTEPLMKRLGINGTARASISFYNNEEDVNLFIDALKKTIKMLK